MIMNLEYQNIFNERGNSYNRAMELYPIARRKEFKNMFKRIPLKANETILDVPSGGGYLSRYYPHNKIVSLEFTKGFNEKLTIVEPFGVWNVNNVDRIVSLAALHHIDNLDDFLQQLIRSSKKGTLIHLADVDLFSNIRYFLDDYVGLWNSSGHKGYYRDWNNINWPKELKVLCVEDCYCDWEFSSINELEEFCVLLFGLNNLPDNQIIPTLEKLVGIEYGDKIILKWKLCYVDLVVTSSTQ